MNTWVLDAPEELEARDAVGSDTAGADTVGADTVGADEAAAELRVELRDLELAVLLGEVRAVGPSDGRQGVPRSEIARLRREEGFPAAPWERLRLVGTISGAEMLGIGRGRFTKLAKCGSFTPVRWYLNRYRSVVWLYLASEMRSFGEAHGDWLSGRLPQPLADRLAAGDDLRARGWRTRATAWLAGQAADGWREAAAWAALLGEEALAEAVPEESDRSRLRQLRPELLLGRAGPPLIRETAEALLLADGREERELASLSLGHALDRARGDGSTPLLPNGDKPRATMPAVPESVYMNRSRQPVADDGA